MRRAGIEPLRQPAVADRVEHVIFGVVDAALRESGAAALTVLDHDTPEGELLVAWLRRRLDADTVRFADDGANDGQSLLVHPVNRTVLLLGGRVPRADLIPFGDVYASQMVHMCGSCTLTDEIRAVADRTGGVDRLDELLAGWIDTRLDADTALRDVAPALATDLFALYERGRYYRIRPRLVPKLGPRTLGIDLWD